MDVLYGDLDNYQDENVIYELRNENRELKCKLDEYASTLARLQKDFDNLSAEYKKLESNYSSLLKTARAEIERKSQLITNLNLEKDKLVIQSVQNRGWKHKRRKNNEDNQQLGNKHAGNLHARNRQAGNQQAGKLHAGNPQAGNQQAGNQQAGDQHAGNPQAGNQQAGDQHAGKLHAGNPQAGNLHARNPQAGNQQAGNQQAGDQHAGNPQAGNQQAENQQAGDQHAGNPQAGNQQAENQQAGDQHAGKLHAGNPQAGNLHARNPQAGNQQAGKLHAGNPQAGNLHARKPQAGNQQAGNLHTRNPQAGNQQAGNQHAGNMHARNPQAGHQHAENQQAGDQHAEKLPVNDTDSEKQQQGPAATYSTAKNVTGTLFTQINNETKDKPDKKHSPDPIPKGEVNAKDNDQKSKDSDHKKDRDINKNNNKKSKEDHADVSSRATSANKVLKIRDRRKSMPLPSREDYKFSSDEDQNDDLRDHRFRRKTPLRDTIDRKLHETNRNGRHYPERKVPEIPRVGDRHGSNYDSTRDVYRKSNTHTHKHRDTDRRRSRDNRDKYEPSQRSRRHYSPVRPQNKMQDENYNKHRGANDTPHWSDNNRYRVLESPPPLDKYTQHSRSRDSDRTRFDRIQNQEVYPMKHKIQSIIEQPPIKRPRSESFNKQSDNHIDFQQDKDICSHITATSKTLDFPYLSLQSPDHIHLENHPVHHVKEIMGTAITKLDDPRLTSKKYLVSTHKDRFVLSTVGKDVGIKVIDTTKWNIDKDKRVHKMPTPLREIPQISEDLVKDIYMGIDHPLSNMSLESGEICLEEEELHTLNNNKSRFIEEYSVNKKDNDNHLQNHTQTQEQVHVDKKEAIVTLPNMQQTSPKIFSKSYRIPKINKQSTSKALEDNIAHSTHKKPDKKDIMKESHKKKINRERTDADEKFQFGAEDQHNNPLKMFSDAIGICKNKSNKFVDISHRKHSSDKALTSARDTVEGDLELSDETCDYTEAADDLIYDKEKNVQSEECNTNSVFGSINRESRSTKLEKKDSKEILVFKHGIDKAENKHFDKQVKGREDHPKQSKEKNKPHKNDKSKDMKSKLCDLFGETSSLITPEDLGIVPSSTTKEILNAYTPLYDNTQDAVDLNIEEMEKVQTRSIKLKPDEPIAKNAQKDVISDKKEKVKKTKKDEKQKSKSSSAKTSPIHQMFQNINTEPAKEDDKTVKTVIISTGMQNNCQTTGSIQEKQEKKLSNIHRKINEKAPNCPLLNLTALATSTPHKEIQIEPSLLVPESSCNSSKSVTKDASDIISGDRKRNSDEPDLRIIVKRRRKHRGKTS